MKTIADVKYFEYKENMLDVHLPDSDEFPVFMYFHGGGLENGSRKVHSILDLAKRGVAVVSVDYRMYPNAVFPQFIEDAAAAVAWTKANMPRYGRVKGLFVGGSSAGEYLTMMLCFDRKYLAKHGLSNSDITGYYHDAGQPTTHFNVLRERGLDTRRVIVDEAAPIYHITDKEVYPPMEFVVSDMDIQNRYEQTMLIVSTLRHFEHDMSKITLNVQKNSTHCSYTGAETENGHSIFADMIYNFMKKYTSYN